jgi:hypothetical protein
MNSISTAGVPTGTGPSDSSAPIADVVPATTIPPTTAPDISAATNTAYKPEAQPEAHSEAHPGGWFPPHKGDGLQVVRGYSNQPGWGEPLNVSVSLAFVDSS